MDFFTWGLPQSRITTAAYTSFCYLHHIKYVHVLQTPLLANKTNIQRGNYRLQTHIMTNTEKSHPFIASKIMFSKWKKLKRAYNFSPQSSGATVHSLRHILTLSLRDELMMLKDLCLRHQLSDTYSTACTLVCTWKVHIYTANQVSLKDRAE